MSQDHPVSGVSIASDLPLVDPAKDAYGYANFAKHIAQAIVSTPAPHGLVMSINGVWGSGKTSLLNFVKYYLSSEPESRRPVVIDFNPWWFNDRTHLAALFFHQFQVRLPSQKKTFDRIRNTLGDYSETIGKIAAVGTGVSWLEFGGKFGKLLKTKPKDVIAVKEELGKALVESDSRFVLVVDDIDRLAAEELRELFKVLKALADFPNVVYLLAFDRSIVASALATTTEQGDKYLDKIVQAAFSIPAVDKLRLRRQLFAKLDALLNSFDTSRFDGAYWSNVYYEGLDHYIETPRDVLRIVNALTVTYPAVAGEVNPVDFIALEFLRLFEPLLYQSIRDNRAMFSGATVGDSGRQKMEVKVFHEAWLNAIRAQRREPLKALMSRLFPRFSALFGGIGYDSSYLSDWRRELRVCSPDTSDVYFQFGLASDLVSRRELDELVQSAKTDPRRTLAKLEEASTVIRPDGTSKARDILDRIRDLEDEISPEAARGLLEALFGCGDQLLGPGDSESLTPNRWRLEWTTRHLLGRVPPTKRPELLKQFVQHGKALGLIVEIIDTADENIGKPESERRADLAGIDQNDIDTFKQIAVERLTALRDSEYLAIADLPFTLHRFSKWAGRDVVVRLLAPLIDSDELLPRLLESYLRFGTRQVAGDVAVTRVPIIHPNEIEPITDLTTLVVRVEALSGKSDLSPTQRVALNTFLDRMHGKKDENGF